LRKRLFLLFGLGVFILDPLFQPGYIFFQGRYLLVQGIFFRLLLGDISLRLFRSLFLSGVLIF